MALLQCIFPRYSHRRTSQGQEEQLPAPLKILENHIFGQQSANDSGKELQYLARLPVIKIQKIKTTSSLLSDQT